MKCDLLYKYLALGGLLIPLLILSCKKDKPEECCNYNSTNCQDIQEVKKYFYFKPGSWWVYEEETSGARDSVYVTSAANDTSNFNFNLVVYSSYQNYYFHFWPVFAYAGSSCQQTGPICETCVFIKRSKTKPGDFVGEQTCFFFVFEKDQNFAVPNTAFSGNKITVNDIMPSFQVNNFVFGKTVKIHELNTYMEGKQPTNHYFSEEIGLVKKELLDSNEVWNLIQYHIE